MRAVVADTAPLNYLVLIAAVEILPRLYESVWIPQAVREELAHRNTPEQVRNWIAQPPSWLIVRSETLPIDSALLRLDPGESQAIALATGLPAALLLIDDRQGGIEARRRGLKTVGTLGVLDEAASRGWIDLSEMFRRLNSTTFRSPRRLMALMLEQHARRIR
jgi:predicted nucleic acid-binding protein